MRKFLVVGLGNPGRKYQRTRHNVGRLVVDWLRKDAEIGERAKFFIPQAFMNQSGAAVLLKLKQEGIETENLIVVHDDVDIEAGEWRVQKNRSSAGHKGVQSIIDGLASQDFWRVRIGVGRPPQETETESYVLKPLPSLVYTKLSKLVADERFKADLRKIYKENLPRKSAR